MTAKLIQHVGSDLSVVNAARVSFDHASRQLSNKDIKLIQYLAKNEHMSPFEHTSATFLIETSMPIAAQTMRHRTFSYNQVSRRYTSDNIKFFFPNWRLQGDPDNGNKQGSHGRLSQEDDAKAHLWYDEIVTNAWATYNALIGLGVCREQARLVLPQGLLTKFWMTGNLRNWAHFLKLRLDNHAQKEVRDLAESIHKQLERIFPHSIGALLND